MACQVRKPPVDGADSIGQEHEHLPLGREAQAMGLAENGPVTAITMEVRVLVKTTVVTPGRLSCRAATLWTPMPAAPRRIRP